MEKERGRIMKVLPGRLHNLKENVVADLHSIMKGVSS
jgi:hypothetical protein